METPKYASLCHYLADHARLRPSAPAWFLAPGDVSFNPASPLSSRSLSSLSIPSRWISWAEVGIAVSLAAEQLCDRGVTSGTRVLTQIGNSWTAAITTLAIDYLGAIESPVDTRAPASEVQRRARILETDICLKHEDWHLAADAVVASGGAFESDAFLKGCRKASTSASWILWTSGTTHEPLGVVLSREGIVANALGKLEKVPQRFSDRRLTVLPLAHAYARTCDFVTWLLSGCVLSTGHGWGAIETIAPDYQPTLMNAVPVLIDRMLGSHDAGGGDECRKSQVDSQRKRLVSLGLAELRILGCGGAALSPERFKDLRAQGIVPIQGYGLTEAGPVICSASTHDYQAGFVGGPISETQLRIAENGELQSRGPGQMLEYWRAPEATEKRITEDGWLCTGDEAEIDPSGQVKILGRIDEVLVMANGKKIHPVEYERLLAAIAGVDHVVIRVAGGRIEAVVDAGGDGCSFSDLWDAVRQSEDRWGGWPKIDQIRIYPRRMTVEGGELTIKGTIRRKIVLRQLESWQSTNEKGRSSFELRPQR